MPYAKTLKDETVILESTLPQSAQVVVIGGGSIGCNTLYHLTKEGLTDVVLLEKDNLTAGTTWHTAGLIWRLRPNDTEVELLKYTRQLLADVLEAETGLNPGWINNGGLFIANNKERLNEYKRLMTLGRAFGVESHVLSPEETKRLYPLMNVNDVYGTLYNPGDGTVDPAGFCTALTRAARKGGAQVIEKCAVTGIQVKEDDFGVRRVEGVETSLGTIRTPCVVNCTGAWAPQIGKMVGVRVPLVAMKHAYVVTNRIEGIQNMPNVRDHDASVYLRLQGDALSVGGYEPNPIFIDDLPSSFAFGLFELDWDVFSIHTTGAINRVPILEQIGIKSTVCGPESFTPDHKPLMGEDPSVRGFFHGCGFNSAGMMLGGGCGRELARWIVQGRPQLDMYGYDIRRFCPKLAGNSKWVRERSHESYAKNYSMVFPHDEPLAGRNARLDPLHKVLQEQGCVYQERLGWERPGWFSPDGAAPVRDYDYYGSYGHPPNEDYRYSDMLKNDYTFDFPKMHHLIGQESLACRLRAALFNMSYFGKFYLTGPDVSRAANWIFTNDVDKPPGATIYTCMVNERGGVEADLTVSTIESGDGSTCDPKFEGQGYYIAAAGGSAYQNYAHILKVIQDEGFKVQLSDLSEDLGLLSLQGPKSRDILQQLTDADLSNEHFPPYTNRVIKVAGHKVRALRMTFVGEMGWELHVPASSCVDVYRALMDAGAKHGLANAGYRAMDSLSIEKGYRHWHADLRLDDTPLEARLSFTCKLNSEVPFLGRSALVAQKKQGLRKWLCCFTLQTTQPLFGLEAIWRNGRVVGHIRTAEYGFALNRTVAYGYVHRVDNDNDADSVVTLDYLKSGTYQLERMGERIDATFHSRSPFDPTNKRIRGIYDEPVPTL